MNTLTATTIPRQTKSLLIRLVFNPKNKVLAKSTGENLTQIDSVELLLRWLNFQLKKAKSNTVNNFGSDLSDCVALTALLGQICSDVSFQHVTQKQTLEERAFEFCQTLEKTNFTHSISYEKIVQGDEIVLVDLIARLYIWKPSLETTNVLNTYLSRNKKTEGYSNVNNYLSKIRNNQATTTQNQYKTQQTKSTNSVENFLQQMKVNKHQTQTQTQTQNQYQTQNQFQTQNQNQNQNINQNSIQDLFESEFQDVGSEMNLNINQEQTRVQDQDQDQDQVQDQEEKFYTHREEFLDIDSILHSAFSETNNITDVHEFLLETRKYLNEKKSEPTILDPKHFEKLDNEFKVQTQVKAKLDREIEKKQKFKDEFEIQIKELRKIRLNKQIQKEYRANLKTRSISQSGTKILMNTEIDTAEVENLNQFLKLSNSIVSAFQMLRQKFSTLFKTLSESLITDELNKSIQDEIKNISNLLESSSSSQHESEYSLLLAIFDLLRSHGVIQNDLTLMDSIKKIVLSLRPGEVTDLFRIREEVIGLLQKNNFLQKDFKGKSFQDSLEALFISTLYTKNFKFQLAKAIIELALVDSNYISNNSKDFNSKENLQKTMFSVFDKFITGNIPDEALIEFLFNLFNSLTITNSKELILKVLVETKKRALGATLRQLCKHTLPKESIDKIETMVSRYHNDELPLVSKCVEKGKTLFSNYLSDDDIIYLTASFDRDNSTPESLEKIAHITLSLMEFLGLSLKFVQLCIAQEVIRTMSALSFFRESDQASLNVTFYTHNHGREFVKRILSGPIQELCNNSNLNFEIEPERLNNNTGALKQNQNNLLIYLNKMVEAIFSTVTLVPKSFYFIGINLKREVNTRFPDSVIITIGGFIFRHFFCQAIKSPFQFGIIDHPPSESAKRGLELISLILNEIANGKLFTNQEKSLQFANEYITSKFNDRSNYIQKISDENQINEEQVLIEDSKNIPLRPNVPIRDYLIYNILSPNLPSELNLDIISGELINYFNGQEYTQLDLKNVKNFNIVTNDFTKLESSRKNLQLSLRMIEKINYLSSMISLKTKKTKESENDNNLHLQASQETEIYLKEWTRNWGSGELKRHDWIYSASNKKNTSWKRQFIVMKEDLLALFDYLPSSEEDQPHQIFKISEKCDLSFEYGLNKNFTFSINYLNLLLSFSNEEVMLVWFDWLDKAKNGILD
ncbi:ras gtpase-activating protein [Anaeramoeba flamelloides]|uniref:Ras gtpase-activating protein n=1 Tax=Anaeramoeba flamelloides TaxID=1746091 RepID=A0ABQ8XPD0_9EUKA|nr:ras gtpase-activating protein [Anaeramoeba flamelloides]